MSLNPLSNEDRRRNTRFMLSTRSVSREEEEMDEIPESGKRETGAKEPFVEYVIFFR